jgi:hypothetical protein
VEHVERSSMVVPARGYIAVLNKTACITPPTLPRCCPLGQRRNGMCRSFRNTLGFASHGQRVPVPNLNTLTLQPLLLDAAVVGVVVVRPTLGIPEGMFQSDLPAF